MDEELKAGHAVEPASDIQLCAWTLRTTRANAAKIGSLVMLSIQVAVNRQPGGSVDLSFPTRISKV
jgi:hypothetical protein